MLSSAETAHRLHVTAELGESDRAVVERLGLAAPVTGFAGDVHRFPVVGERSNRAVLRWMMPTRSSAAALPRVSPSAPNASAASVACCSASSLYPVRRLIRLRSNAARAAPRKVIQVTAGLQGHQVGGAGVVPVAADHQKSPSAWTKVRAPPFPFMPTAIPSHPKRHCPIRIQAMFARPQQCPYAAPAAPGSHPLAGPRLAAHGLSPGRAGPRVCSSRPVGRRRTWLPVDDPRRETGGGKGPNEIVKPNRPGEVSSSR